MSEIINNSESRKESLKHLLVRLHNGEPQEILKKRIAEVINKIPYNEVMQVEQELINEGKLTQEEILMFCDIHSAVLEGSISSEGSIQVPEGHPVDVFKQENRAVEQEAAKIKEALASIDKIPDTELDNLILKILASFNMLNDLDKHYKRKEYLIFPYIEKHGITGPSTVMWGKDDEIREELKNSIESLKVGIGTKDELKDIAEFILNPCLDKALSMIMKEEEILFPTALDVLSEEDWYKIHLETLEFGYCIIEPKGDWKPSINIDEIEHKYIKSDGIRLSSGSFDYKELEALFVHLPVDITFVDKNDKVKFFSHSPKRVFERNLSIIGRDVRMCHPPGSVHIVEEIISDFKSGKENKACFWLSNFMGRFVHIEYSALRGSDGEYLGVIEITQDITELRSIQGDQRLLSYESK